MKTGLFPHTNLIENQYILQSNNTINISYPRQFTTIKPTVLIDDQAVTAAYRKFKQNLTKHLI